jgi:acyl-CoA synthetase (AMP-forming)/AMP-acid ligase II
MSKTSLKAEIARVAAHHPDRPALISSGGTLCFGQLVEARWQGDGISVVVFCKAIHNAIRALIALDGKVSAICLLPVDLPEKTLTALLGKWAFDTVISDLPVEELTVFEAAGLTLAGVGEIGHDDSGKAAKALECETIWLVPTSGTTALPKLVMHTFQSLALAANKPHGPVTETQVWALLYDPSRFAGYQVLFRALISGHTLVAPGLTEPMDERVVFCARNGVSHISATPTLWRKILMSPSSKDLTLRQITLGGEAADQPVLSALVKAFPDARVTHIYASTEAGVGLSVSDGKAGFPTSFLGANDAGVEITLKDGRLFVRSARAGQKYTEDADFCDAEGWIDTGDMVSVEDDRFFIVGRSSGVLNVGGDKVVPEQVRHILLEHAIVVDAVVYGKTNPFTGTLLAADIKLSRGTDPAEARGEIDDFLKERLSSAQRPRVFRFVDEIVTNSTGKVIQA